MRVAVCPGSFDPVTLGHMDIVRRAARQFDRVYLCAMVNDRKGAGLLTAEERRELLALAAAEMENVIADSWGGLLVDYAKKVGAGAVVKGIRDEKDLGWELEMAEYNRRADLELELETILLPAKETYRGISSTLVRECIASGKEWENYVPAAVVGALQQLQKRKGW